MFRLASKNDYIQFKNLMNQVHKIHHAGLPSFYKEKMEEFPMEQYLEEIKSENIHVLIEDGKMIGFSYSNIIQIQDNPAILDHSFLYIIDICVDEKYRRKGYGKYIYNELIKINKEKGCKAIKLDVYEFNKAAIKFYQKIGLKTEKISMNIEI